MRSRQLQLRRRAPGSTGPTRHADGLRTQLARGSSATKTRRPAWAAQYAQYDAWSQVEVRNLLLGLPPHPPDDTPDVVIAPREKKAARNRWVQDELRRVAVDRHIEDAIVAGHLQLASIDQEFFKRVSRTLSDQDQQRLSRALAHQSTCLKAPRFTRVSVIRWAVARRELFPNFPFTLEGVQVATAGRAPLQVVQLSEPDTTAQTPKAAAPVPPARERLRAHRYKLLNEHQQRQNLNGRQALARSLGMSKSTIEAIVRDEPAKYGRKKKHQLLQAIGVTEAVWNTPT
jgi:hypothetical protein